MPYRFTTLPSTYYIQGKDPSGACILVTGAGIPVTTVNVFASGCVYIDRVANLIYINRGTSASPTWIPQVGQFFTVAVLTNGTTPVNVFPSGSTAPCPLTVTSVVAVAQDTTAGNITLSQAANTVVTIAKGTTSGALVGGVSLAHTVYATADTCQVVSSTAGNAIVQIVFQLA